MGRMGRLTNRVRVARNELTLRKQSAPAAPTDTPFVFPPPCCCFHPLPRRRRADPRGGTDGLLPARQPVPRLRGAARARVPHGGARRGHRRCLLLRRRRLLLGPDAPRRGHRGGRCCRRPRRVSRTWVLFILQLALILWCYLMVVFTDPGSVPENWRHDAEDSGDPPSSTSEDQGNAPRYCSRCQNGKPPRCHHCSVCDRCVLKMDHHCIWVVNCVGARNHKYFLLFLVYTFLETVLDTLVLLPYFIEYFQDGSRRSSSPSDIAILFLAFVLNFAFALSLLCFISMHLSLVLRNTTSVEIHGRRKSVPWKYDVGWRRNLEQVFGSKKLLWFFPLYSTDDMHNIPALRGLEFPTRSDAIV